MPVRAPQVDDLWTRIGMMKLRIGARWTRLHTASPHECPPISMKTYRGKLEPGSRHPRRPSRRPAPPTLRSSSTLPGYGAAVCSGLERELHALRERPPASPTSAHAAEQRLRCRRTPLWAQRPRHPCRRPNVTEQDGWVQGCLLPCAESGGTQRRPPGNLGDGDILAVSGRSVRPAEGSDLATPGSVETAEDSLWHLARFAPRRGAGGRSVDGWSAS